MTTTTKFKLNTATRSFGRVKGWNCTCDLWETVKRVTKDDVPALIAAIEKQLNKAIEKCAEEQVEMKRIRESSCNADWKRRSENRAWNRWNRADDKARMLKQALVDIQKKFA